MTYPIALRYEGSVERGATLPQRFVVAGVGLCAVKFAQNPQGVRALVNEWLGFAVADVLGLEHPDCGVVEVSALVLPHAGQLKVFQEYTQFGQQRRDEFSFLPGLALYSKWLSPVSDLRPEDVRSFTRVANQGFIAGVALLDLLTGNWDRRPVNPNLLLYRDRSGHRIQLIDLDRCFGSALWTAHSLRSASLPPLEQPLPYVGDMTDYFSNINALTDFKVYLDKLRLFTPARVKAMVDGLPPDWGVVPQERQALVHYLTSRAAALPEYLAARLEHNTSRWH